MMGQLFDAGTLRLLSQAVADGLTAMCGSYRGPLGVDMMVVDVDGMRAVHPCVEVNVRRTMGMVAVDVARRTNGHFHVMTVDVSGPLCQLHLKEKEQKTT